MLTAINTTTKPLYDQMEAEHSEPFEWGYLLAMPEEWKVNVMKQESLRTSG